MILIIGTTALIVTATSSGGSFRELGIPGGFFLKLLYQRKKKKSRPEIFGTIQSS